ncbi:unnamed protein product [Dovyalis caffra]|uniref:Uncharacterized protein n=1 Tax=Dovyalis caffra TaxID=77055 RepID=A0AAV1QNB7_9ROSI|nr:unnamed protein product [Dovyalis caffra]
MALGGIGPGRKNERYRQRLHHRLSLGVLGAAQTTTERLEPLSEMLAHLWSRQRLAISKKQAVPISEEVKQASTRLKDGDYAPRAKAVASLFHFSHFFRPSMIEEGGNTKKVPPSTHKNKAKEPSLLPSHIPYKKRESPYGEHGPIPIEKADFGYIPSYVSNVGYRTSSTHPIENYEWGRELRPQPQDSVVKVTGERVNAVGVLKATVNPLFNHPQLER